MKYTRIERDNNQGIVIPVSDVNFDDQYYYMLALQANDMLVTLCIQVHPRNVVSIEDGDGHGYSMSDKMNHVVMKDYHLTASLDIDHGELIIIVPTQVETYLSDRIL